MTITNKTGVVLTVLDKVIRPGQTKEYSAKYDAGITVSSDAGCCIIYAVEGKIKFKYEGNLIAKYSMRKDRRGHKSVNVFSKV